MKVREGYLTPAGIRASTGMPAAAQIDQWAAGAGGGSARALWSAPPPVTKAALSDDHPGRRTYLLTPQHGLSGIELSARLRALPWVEWTEVDRLMQLHQDPSDSLYPRQWHLENSGQGYWSVISVAGDENDTLAELHGTPGADINFLAPHNAPGPKSPVIVGIIDTGIDTDHEDLADRLYVNPGEIPDNGIDDDHNGFVDDILGWDFSGDVPVTPNEIVPDNDISDSIGHGTHVAGTVAATTNNNVGIAGVADSARVLGVKIFPNAFFSVSSQAIYYAVSRGARVINMSWGGGFPSNALEDALAYAHSRGVVLVASMGNSGRDEVFYPSGYPMTIGVGASTANDRLATFSTYNDHVDLVAPGQDVLSLRAAGTDLYAAGNEPGIHIIDERYYISSGTSMAAPHATGAVAALLSVAPGLSSERVREILETTADDIVDPYGDGSNLPGFDRLTGWGRINLQAAMSVLPGVFVTINSPSYGAWIGGTVDIIGSASGGSFSGFTLSYALGHNPGPSEWVTITSSATPVSDGLLSSWNTSGLDGPCTLRLDGGPDAAFKIPVNIVQTPTAAIASPPDGSSERLAVTVIGTATGPGFESYRLEAVGPLPSSTLHPVGTFTRPVWSDTLAIWELEGLPSGDYWLRLALQSAGGTASDSVMTTVDDIFHENWPVTLPAHAHFSVTAADIDGYANAPGGRFQKEIICPTNRGLWVLTAGGENYPGWPRDTLVNYRTPPALADLDKDGKLEIVVATPDAMHVYAFIGEEYAGWPRPFDGTDHFYGVSLPTVGDIDGDGDLEIAAIDQGGHIKVWREDGTTYTPSLTPNFGAISINGSASNSLPQARICDLDRDGQSELIAIGDEIRVFNGRTGRPYRNLASPRIASHHSVHAAVIGDFDYDTRREVAYVATNDQGSRFVVSVVGVQSRIDTSTNTVFDTVITLPGWPRTLPAGADKFLLYAISAGDIDRDGLPELFVAPYSLGEGLLYAFRADGEPLLPGSPDGLFARLPGSASSIALVDIDHDGDAEVVFRVGEFLFGADRIFALEADGGFVTGYPIIFGSGSSTTLSTPIVADINGDNLLDMVTVQSTGTSIALWDLGTPVSSKGSIWTKFQSDRFNSGVAITPLYDAVYMYRVIDYVFFGAAAFPPYEPHDVNCDGFTDVIDIAFLIDYLFLGGQLPCVP